MGISTPWICLPASLSKTRYCASLHPTRNAILTPKMTFEFAFAAQQNDLRTFNQAFLPRKARKESGNSSPVSPGHRSKMAARR